MIKCRTGKDSVTVEIMLHFLLRWFAGGSYLDIKLSAGISKAAFYNYILDHEVLAYKFPDTAKELNEAAQGFES